jgi:serine/threonine protein kinase
MPSVRPGHLLAGKYRVERVLGQGGMGYVVAARHLQLDQLVAMKFLRAGALDETEAVARFVREARACVRLRNEHVARVYDVGTLDTGEPYMVMEYLDGCDLAALSKQRGGGLAISEACEYVLQACEALGEAHSLGIVHRDVKLANLFVTRGPTGAPLVKVLDFGISKSNPFGESEHDMTRTTSMLGSPRFMSPEQMRDPRAVDPRSDIWSLGVVLYRLACGKAPFEADTLGRLLTMVMHEQASPPRAVRPDLPPGFDAVVMRCLEKDPEARFANVAELAYALSPYASDPARAAAAAARMAATLSVVGPSTLEIPRAHVSSCPSGPPAVMDTGTASPWTDTRSAHPSRARSTLIGVAVTLATLLVVGAGASKLHARVSASDGTSVEAAVAVAAAAAPAPPEPSPIAPHPVVIESPPSVPAPPTATEPAATAGSTPPAASVSPGKRRVAPPVRRSRPPPSSPAVAAPARTDEGIPSTRD